MPTLSKLPKDIPVVTNAEAAEKIKPLGYTNVTVVDHGQTVEVAGGKLRITASEGALEGVELCLAERGSQRSQRSGRDCALRG